MGLPYWDRLRRQYRRQREQARLFGSRAPLVFFLLAWFAAQAPVGEAAPAHASQQNVESPVNSAYTGATWSEKAAAEASRLRSILKARLLHPDLLQINNDVVLSSTAVAVMVYTVAAICILIKIRSDGKQLLHASATRGGRGGKIPYVISILTGYMPGAGTSAEVLLRIVGTDDISPYVNISKVAKSIGRPNPVRRGERTTFTLWVPDSLGPIEWVEIKLHKCTEKTAWLLKYVKLIDPQFRAKYYACVDNWLQGTATHKYNLDVPCMVSRWRQVQISFRRAFSRLFIWSFWSGSRVSGMSSFASLSLCSLLVLSVMSACAVYLYIITQETQVFQSGVFRPEGQSMTTLLVMLKPEHLLVLLKLIVTIAAIGWTLEVLIRCVKKAKAKYRPVQRLPQPKGNKAKKLGHDKACGTEKPINSGLQKQPKNNDVYKQKNDIDIRKMLENRVKDLPHNSLEETHKQDPEQVVAKLAEELVQEELTQQACQQVAQQRVEMNEDSSLAAMAEGCLLDPAAFGSLPSGDPMVQVAQDVFTKALAKALLQTKEEMNQNACNNTSAGGWTRSLMSALGLSNHSANNAYYYQINGEEVDFTDAGATHWSELQLNQNHTVIDMDQNDTVIDMDQNHCEVDTNRLYSMFGLWDPLPPHDKPVLDCAARPPFPAEVDGALLDLDESTARQAPGCLPSAFIYLVYLLLLLLGAVLVASLVLYGGVLPSVLTLTWLVYVMVGLALHMLVLEPLKVLLMLACTGTLA